MGHPIKAITRLKMALKVLDKKWYRWNGKAIESCKDPEKINARDLLSEKKLEIFIKATNLGYYSFPRRISLKGLSKELGLSPSTVCIHLQKIEAKLIGMFTIKKTENETNPDKILELIKVCKEGDCIVWDEPNGEVFKIKLEKKYPANWSQQKNEN